MKLRELYQSKLKQAAKYVRYFEMRDRQDRTQYYLFFATNNELGHLKMKEAMWKVDPDGEFRFSDATNPNQLVLFEADATPTLVDQLRKEFRSKGTVTGFEVRKFVEDKTAYLKKHMTAALKQQEEATTLRVEPLKTDGKKRRPHTYPNEASLTWAWRSAIEWTESTWNPVTGCTKVSPGCKCCYAERMAERLQVMGQENYRHGFRLTLQPHMLDQPLCWKRPQTIFVNSMSDLFHKDVPLDYIQRVFDVMRRAHWHRFQVLTKRSARLAELDPKLEWAPNIWMGVSVESDKYRSRIDHLRATRALIKFLSLEPLLGLSTISTCAASTGRSWAANQGPRHGRWIPRGRSTCATNVGERSVPFFFKQWGGKNKKQAGRVLDGRTWDEMPMLPDTTVPMVRPRGRRTSLAVVP